MGLVRKGGYMVRERKKGLNGEYKERGLMGVKLRSTGLNSCKMGVQWWFNGGEGK